MKARGHYGGTLLVGSAFVLWLGLLYGSLAVAVMLVFARTPDWDQYIDDTVIGHREETHTLAFVIGFAFVIASTAAFPAYAVQDLVTEFGVIDRPIISAIDIWLFVGLSVSTTLLTHILVDTLTKGGGFKIKLFYPVSSSTIAFGLCESSDDKWNTALLASGVTAFFAACIHEFVYSVEIIGFLS